jgi:hypothetical protein
MTRTLAPLAEHKKKGTANNETEAELLPLFKKKKRPKQSCHSFNNLPKKNPQTRLDSHQWIYLAKPNRRRLLAMAADQTSRRSFQNEASMKKKR